MQGLDKKETALKYGEEKVNEWRRGYHTKPPLLLEHSKNNSIELSNYNDLNIEIPLGESLEDVVNRVVPILKAILDEALNENVLVVAHGNSIRAMVKLIENISHEDLSLIHISEPTRPY